MKKLFSLAAAIVFVSAGCHGQVPPSPAPTVTITWTAPSTCSSGSSCAYVASRCTVVAPATTCPSYTPLNSTAPVSALTFTDTTPPTGVSVLYVVQTVQGGLTGVASGPSNGGTPLPVPIYPGTPGSPNATQNAMLAPPLITDRQPEVMADLRGPAGPGIVRAVIAR